MLATVNSMVVDRATRRIVAISLGVLLVATAAVGDAIAAVDCNPAPVHHRPSGKHRSHRRRTRAQPPQKKRMAVAPKRPPLTKSPAPPGRSPWPISALSERRRTPTLWRPSRTSRLARAPMPPAREAAKSRPSPCRSPAGAAAAGPVGPTGEPRLAEAEGAAPEGVVPKGAVPRGAAGRGADPIRLPPAEGEDSRAEARFRVFRSPRPGR